MRPSDWPLRYKIYAVVLFVALMLPVYWLAHQVAYVWLPPDLAEALGAGLTGLAVGYLLGLRSARREIAQRTDSGLTSGHDSEIGGILSAEPRKRVDRW